MEAGGRPCRGLGREAGRGRPKEKEGEERGRGGGGLKRERVREDRGGTSSIFWSRIELSDFYRLVT